MTVNQEAPRNPAEVYDREFASWAELNGYGNEYERDFSRGDMHAAFTAGMRANTRLFNLSETVDRSARGALLHDQLLPEGLSPEVVDSDPPGVYARWCRAGWPSMTDESVAAAWRWRSAGEYQFWLALAAAELERAG